MNELDKIKSHLRELTALNALSGDEAEAACAMADHLRPLADSVRLDAFGNVIAERAGGRAPSLMIAAHSDEVGAMVRSITPDGFLRFHTIGFVAHSVLPGTRVRVAAKFPGVIGAPPAHLESETDRLRVKPPGELYVDIGASDEAEARQWGVREGDAITFVADLIDLYNSERVMGKAIDNRVGCAILLHLFESLQGETLPGKLYGVVNVQEEIGSRGARMTTSNLCPDWAIALDTVPADDSPSPGERLFGIGKGPVIQLIEGKPDAFIGTIIHPRVRDYILRTAAEEQIPVQLSAAYGSWATDAAMIHISGEGVPTGFVSVPRRYAHSPNEVMDLNDAVGAVHLLAALVRRETVDLSFSLVP
jgi:endoglucanase